MPLPLQPHEVAGLGSAGYFVRTGWLSRSIAQPASVAFQKLTGFEPAGMGRGAERNLSPEMRGDERIWLDRSAPWESLEPVLLAFEQLKDALNHDAHLGLDRLELQGSRYVQPGGRYARHKDSFAGRAGRRVTFIYYFNDHWLPDHGGCLRLHVAPTAVDVPPLLDSLVVFLSEKIEHEVLATFVDRFALTAWWSGLPL